MQCLQPTTIYTGLLLATTARSSIETRRALKMPDLFEHHLASYKREIEDLGETLRNFASKWDRSKNLTHASMALGNRANLIVIGLTNLTEAKLYDVAVQVEGTSVFKISDIKGSSLERLKIFLARNNIIRFGELKSWPAFRKLYDVRNAIVHGHAGIVLPADTTKFVDAIKFLQIEHVFWEPRIHFDTPALQIAHQVASEFISELEQRAVTPGG